jgi:hypothetical protein
VMAGLGTYERVVGWVSTEMCVVEEERGGRIISETTWTTTGDLEPPHATTQPPFAPKSANCWSPVHSKPYLAIFVLPKCYRQFGASPQALCM